jgi:hypothetical protein
MKKFILKLWQSNKFIKRITFEAENETEAEKKITSILKKNPHSARMSQRATFEKFTF